MTNPNLNAPAENFLALGRAAAESFRVTFGYDYVEFNYFKSPRLAMSTSTSTS